MGTTVDPCYLQVQARTEASSIQQDSITSVNPLEPFMSQINRCRFLGFPLKLVGLHLEPYSFKYGPLCANFFIILIFHITLAVGTFYGEMTRYTTNWFHGQGYKNVDMLGMAGVLIPQGFGLMRQNSNLLLISQQWNQLNRFIGKVLNPDDVSSCYEQARRTRVFNWIFLAIISCLSVGMSWSLFMEVLPLTWFLPVVGAQLVLVLLTFHPFSLFLIFAILRHYLLLFKKVIFDYNRRTKVILIAGLSPTQLTSFLNDGVELVEALALFDATFGGVITMEVALCLIIEIFGSYFGSSLYQVLVNQNMKIFCFVIAFAVLGIQGFVRYYILTRNGQALTNAMKDCHASLTRLDIQSSPLTPVQEKQMTYILTRFSQPTAWSPMGLFDLSQASCVMIHSVIVTYLVVLIQFKEVATGM